MDNGIIRNKGGFTVVFNTVARDARLSLKAKGLYLLIQSHITMPDKQWTKDDFIDKAIEGEKAFESGWKELKNAGYLKSHFYPVNGKFRIEYELLNEPDDGPHTIYYDAKGNITTTNIEKELKNNAKRDKNSHTPQNGTYGNGSNRNGTNNNKDSIVNTNTTREKENITLNDSVYLNTKEFKEISVLDSLAVGAFNLFENNEKAPGG